MIGMDILPGCCAAHTIGNGTQHAPQSLGYRLQLKVTLEEDLLDRA